MEFKTVTSLANPEIKRIRSLAQRKYREQGGVFLTEGLRHALEAAEAGWQFETLVVEDAARNRDLVQKLVTLLSGQDCHCLSVPRELMENLAKRDNAQTVMAVIRQQWLSLNAVTAGLWVALEEIRDPGNLGTIMRTADAVGARGIVLIGNTCDPYALESIRASMGSFPHVAFVRCERQEFIDWRAATPAFSVIGTHLRIDHDYRDVAYSKPLILVMGNEQAGLSEALSATCTQLVKIPMQGKADSLNVSVATALMLYEVQREHLKIHAD